MDSEISLVTVKQEPPEKEKVKVPEASEPAVKVQSENAVEPGALKTSKSLKKTNSTEKTFDIKRIKKEPQACGVKEGKAKKTPGGEIESTNEVPRAGIFPHRTKSDFCCTICNAHMNSIQMWESHIRGKRHLKNCKKGPVTVPAVPVKTEADDVSGLYYIDTQGAQSPPHDNVIYEKPESPTDNRQKESHSPEHSPPATSTCTSRNFNELTMTERMNYILQLSASLVPQNESDFNEIQSILAALTQSILQYEIRQLPFAAQQKLAKELFRGN